MIDPRALAAELEADPRSCPLPLSKDAHSEARALIIAALWAYEPPHVHDWPKMWWTGEEGVRWSRACMGRGCGKIQYADLVPVEETP